MTLSAVCYNQAWSQPRRSDEGHTAKPGFVYETYVRVNGDFSANFVAIERLLINRQSKSQKDQFAVRFWTIRDGQFMRYSRISRTNSLRAQEITLFAEENGFELMAEAQESFNHFIDAGAAAFDVKSPAPVVFYDI
jgi:hypothetical protein